ncbi:tRNA (adenosine(37)-N6)-dimethylallyltransferase MiaA [Patescibacteria group bacterium]|nr:tRNA (adenosine(37)-N6)-dimethylallyltransferase MiaA [Patescibacteria group bacterium]
MKKQKKRLIVIYGPTSSGKTLKAVKMAYKLNAEIVSADSRQVYKYMDIGSGKDLEDYIYEGKKIPYHCIDIVHPNTNFNLKKYQKKAFQALDNIYKKNKNAILCGGTGLYIEAIINEKYFLDEEVIDIHLRKSLNKKNKEELQNILKNKDKEKFLSLNNSDLNNPRRLIRYIEKSHNTKNQVRKKYLKILNYFNIEKIEIKISKEILNKNIEKRANVRFKNGMIEEVWNLHFKYDITWKRLKEFGLEYQVISDFIINFVYNNTNFDKKEIIIKNNYFPIYEIVKNKKEFIKMKEDLIQKTKNYVKRQETWNKKYRN